MHLDRRFANAGVFLVALGAVPLAVQAGAIDASNVADAWRLWPILLILAGIGILLSRTRVQAAAGLLSALTVGLIGGGLIAAGWPGFGAIGCGGGSGGSAFTSSTGDLGSSSASVDLTVGCGHLRAMTRSGTTWSLSGTSSDGRPPAVSADPTSLRIQSQRGGGFFDLGTARSTWDLALPTAPALDLGLTLNAGTARLGLGGARLGSVDVTVNAGSGRMDLSGATALGSVGATVNAGELLIGLPAQSAQGSFTVNAGHLGICVPAGVGLRVQTSGALGSNNLADRGLAGNGAVWTTPGYDAAPVKIDIDATINAGNLELDPNGGCS
ncbi:MAG: hypothetical protein ACYDAK_03115 [Candidatus Limnocylindrales bacterium]